MQPTAEHRLIARIEGPENEIVQAIRTLDHIEDVYSLGEKEPGVFEISVEGEAGYDLRRNLFMLLTRKGWPMLALRNTDLTLEEVFLMLTSSDISLVQHEEEPEEEAAAEEAVETEETKEDAE